MEAAVAIQLSAPSGAKIQDTAPAITLSRDCSMSPSARKPKPASVKPKLERNHTTTAAAKMIVPAFLM